MHKNLDHLSYPVPEDIQRLIAAGDLQRANAVIEKRLASAAVPECLKERLRFEQRIIDQLPRTYTVTEVLGDDSLWQCTTENPQTVTVEAGQTAEVTFTNALRPGEIRIQKVDTKGEPLDGVEFLLEWSEDGVNWSPVTYTESAIPQVGGCTSEGLTNGRLVSSMDGLVTFSGLHPTLQYRLTETATKDGYQLLKGYAYEGNLPAEHDLTVTLTVVNAEIFTMPKTGSNALTMMPVALVLCLGICMVSIVSIRKKEV